MKKRTTRLILFLCGAAALIILTRLIRLALNWKQKAAMTVSIIGGADGPTSVFLAGKIPAGYNIASAAAGVVLLLLIAWLIWKIRKRSEEEE